MNFCPECGSAVGFDKVEADVATDHYHYTCVRWHRWVETVDRNGGLIHITPDGIKEDSSVLQAADRVQ